MTMHARGSFESTSWEEQPLRDVDGAPKLAHASMVSAFQGDIEGQGSSEYLISYLDSSQDGKAYFVGSERVSGQIGDRSGGFLIHSEGIHANSGLQATWKIVPGSGSGDLQGLKGGGTCSSDGSHTVTYSLDYDFE